MATTTTYGSTAAQDLLKRSFGTFNAGQGLSSADDEVRLLNGLLALGWPPEKVAALADADPNRKFLGDAVTRALRMGISEDQIRRAINFDEIARTEMDPTRRVQRMAETLGLDMGRVTQLANQRGGTPEAWIGAVEEISRSSQMPNTQTLMGSDIARQTFRQYATFQPATYTGKGQAPGTGPGGATLPAQPVSGQPPAPFEQRSGGWRMPGTSGSPTLTGQTPGAGGPGGGTPAGPGAGGTPAPRKLTPAEIRADIEARYGWAAAFMDIPEVAKILEDAANGKISPEEANRRWLGTNYYKSTSVNERNWRILEKSDPGEAAMQMRGQVDSITSRANALGIQLDPSRAQQIAELSKRHGWSDQQIAAAIASEAKYDPSGAKTGVLAQVKGIQQNMLVPLSDQAMTQWAQAIIGGTQTIADFEAYMKDQAKSLFPTIAGFLDQTPGGTVKQYLDPYAETISQTLGMPAGDINWMDPKWFRFVNSTDPKTGQRGVVNIADVQKYLITDPQYGFDQTTNGKQQKAAFARTMLEDWGFATPSQGGLR